MCNIGYMGEEKKPFASFFNQEDAVVKHRLRILGAVTENIVDSLPDDGDFVVRDMETVIPLAEATEEEKRKFWKTYG